MAKEVSNKTSVVLLLVAIFAAMVFTLSILNYTSEPDIADTGIFGPVTRLAGSIAVGQIMKILLGKGSNVIIEVNAWTPKIKITKL